VVKFRYAGLCKDLFSAVDPRQFCGQFCDVFLYLLSDNTFVLNDIGQRSWSLQENVTTFVNATSSNGFLVDAGNDKTSTEIVLKNQVQWIDRKVFSIEDRGPTDRVTMPIRTGLHSWPRPRHAVRLAALKPRETFQLQTFMAPWNAWMPC